MSKIILVSFFAMVYFQFACAQHPLPKSAYGAIERLEGFQSKYVASRHIDVWLPAGYDGSSKYAVLYMHDGQMLYDAETTWNKQAWDVDDVATELFKTGNVKEFIVVGIHNSGKTRHPEYFPQKPFEQLSQRDKDSITAELIKASRISEAFSPFSDRYLKFIVEELKPAIDKKYPVYTDKENTIIAGSSMGGLISFYAMCEYPEIFGGAVCMSTHWVGTFTIENNPIPNAFISYLSENLPLPGEHKIYFDCGDQTLDALYPEIQQKVDGVMEQKGYTNQNWMTQYFPGENHSEEAWNKRLHIPLGFLFEK